MNKSEILLSPIKIGHAHLPKMVDFLVRQWNVTMQSAVTAIQTDLTYEATKIYFRGEAGLVSFGTITITDKEPLTHEPVIHHAQELVCCQFCPSDASGDLKALFIFQLTNSGRTEQS